MEDKMIPYFVHEGDMSRLERTIKRLWVLCILLVIMLVATNGAWLWYENQWEDVVTTETYEADAEDSGVAIANGAGEVNYNGEGKIHEDYKDQET